MSEKPKKWIKGATENKGALHRHLGIPEGDKIPEDKLNEAANSKDKTIAKEARLALTLKGLPRPKKKAESKEEPKSDVLTSMYGAKSK